VGEWGKKVIQFLRRERVGESERVKDIEAAINLFNKFPQRNAGETLAWGFAIQNQRGFSLQETTYFGTFGFICFSFALLFTLRGKRIG
jgi:hypothetical protein